MNGPVPTRAARTAAFAGAAALAIVLMSCGRTEPSAPAPGEVFAPISGEGIFKEARRIVDLGPRDAATPGAARAARHIRARLQAQGVAAEVDAFGDSTPRGEATFRNVIGRLPGRGRGIVILGSHYDTKSGMPPRFEGANDSASSTAVLIHLAGILARGPKLDPEIWLVFFDGEEAVHGYGPNDGLHGSRRLAANLLASRRTGEVRAVIVLDMVGDRDLTLTIPRNGSPELVSALFKAASAEGVRAKFALYPFEIGDDHEPFLKIGLPAVDVIDFAYGSGPGRNDYWHTAEDRMDKLSAESLEIVGRVVLRMLVNLGTPSGP